MNGMYASQVPEPQKAWIKTFKHITLQFTDIYIYMNHKYASQVSEQVNMLRHYI